MTINIDLVAERDAIRQLFDAVAHERKMREAEVFRRCYEQLCQERLSAFLKDVATCPPEVVAFCQELLAHKPDRAA